MFEDIFNDVKELLSENDLEATKIGHNPFRKRSEHIWRVFNWAIRLIDEGGFNISIDRDSVLIAALFHDSGYAVSLDGSKHAENSADVFQQYARANKFDLQQQDFITYLIRNHSKKALLNNDDTPLELVILMEADLLDETGALSIVWDCMTEGALHEQSFIKTFEHIKSYSGRILNSNPMKTDKAIEYWANKQNLVKEFLEQLSFDLSIGNQ